MKHKQATKWAISMAVILLLFEGLLRLLFPVPEVNNFNRTHYQQRAGAISDRDLYLENKTWESSPDTPHVFVHALNNYGFRDHHWQVKKHNKKRIAFVGDSFTEGTMANDDETLPAYYQELSGEEVEVMNAGMNGTSTDHYFRLIKDFVPLFKPDELHLVLYANDFSEERGYNNTLPFQAKWNTSFMPRLWIIIDRFLDGKPIRLRGVRPSMGYLFPVPAATNPFTYGDRKLSKHVRVDIRQAMINATFNAFVVNYLKLQEEYLKRPISLAGFLSATQQICLAQQCELVVHYIPSRNQISDDYIAFDKASCLVDCKTIKSLKSDTYNIHGPQLMKDCEALDIKAFDHTIALKNASHQRSFYWNYDEHFRPLGYAFIANRIHKEMVKFQ